MLAAPVIVVSAPGAAERVTPREPAHPPHLHAAPAAPGLPVHGTLPVTAPTPVAAHGPAAPAPTLGAVDVTLPVGLASSHTALPATPQRPAASVDASLQRTALSEDYLREARQAALEAVARSSPQAPAAPASGADPFAATASADLHEPPPASFGTRPSIAAPLPHGPPPSSAVGAAPVVTSRGFEPVPIPRAPLAESLSGNLGPVADVGGLRNGAAPSSTLARGPLPVRRSGDAVLRWLLLAAVALVSIATVMVGQRVWHRYQEAEGRPLSVTAASADSPSDTTERALLSNRPAVDLPPPGRALVVSASHPQPGEGSSPSPESQLAATAGRHVLAGNYAEALPVYQQLERAFPENTAYAAMSRLLKEKVGTSSDTRTVAPAPASKGKKK